MLTENKKFSYLVYCENENLNPACEEYFKNKNNIPQYFTNEDFDEQELIDSGWIQNEFSDWLCKSCTNKNKHLKRKH